MISKLERVKKALEVSIGIFDSLDVLPKYTKQVKVALAELNEVIDRLNSEGLNTEMQIAYNQVLLNQPEDNRDATKAMRAAINIIRGKEYD